MPENRVSASLSAEEREAVLAILTTLRQKLPFLLALAEEESKGLTRLGDKSRAFVAKASELATRHPEILPPAFDLQEMQADLALFESLYPIQMAMSELYNLVSDTTAVAGSEAYAAARLVYSYAKTSGLNAELEPLLMDLGKRFRRSPRKTANHEV